MASGKKRTFCAEALMNRSASSASVTKEPYPMIMRGERTTDYVSNFLYPNFRKNLVGVQVQQSNSLCLIT